MNASNTIRACCAVAAVVMTTLLVGAQLGLASVYTGQADEALAARDAKASSILAAASAPNHL